MDGFRVGVVIKPHGVKGAVKVFPTTSEIKRFSRLKSVMLSKTDKEEDIEKTFQVESVQYFKNQVILKLSGIDSPEEAEKIRGFSLWILEEEALPLQKDEYYLRDFLNASAVLEDGEEFGTVYDILETGSNEVFVIHTKDHQEVLLPVIKDCIISMDPKAHKVVIHLLKGMME